MNRIYAAIKFLLPPLPDKHSGNARRQFDASTTEYAVELKIERDETIGVRYAVKYLSQMSRQGLNPDRAEAGRTPATLACRSKSG